MSGVVTVGTEHQLEAGGRVLTALPPFPAVARKLLSLLDKPTFTIPEVAQLVKSDAVFASEVLRLANSALIGLRYEVVSILHAISVLGMDRLRSLVLTVAMRDFLRGAGQQELLRQCWRHNLACAMTAEALADSCWIERSEAYTAGLLHDLGRLALIAAYPEQYKAASDCWAKGGHAALDCERKVLGIDHCQAGRALAEAWSLPSALHEVLCLKLVEPEPEAFSVVKLVDVACGLADRFGFHLGGATPELDPAWVEERVPAAACVSVQSRVADLAQSIPVKVNLFECEFLNR